MKMSTLGVIPDCGGVLVEDSGGGGEQTLPPLVLDNLVKFSGNGIVISGVVAWMVAQMETFASDIWKSLAERCFEDCKVTAAKDALKSTSGPFIDTLLPDFKKNRIGTNKKSTELDDIKKAISALKQAGEMPLVLATSKQLTRCPQSWGVPASPTNQDVIGKIGMLEKALADSIELHKEQLNQVKVEIATLRTSLPRSSSVPVTGSSGVSVASSPTIPLINLTGDSPKNTQSELEVPNPNNQQPSYAAMNGVSTTTNQHQQSFKMLQSIFQSKHQHQQSQPSKNQDRICIGSGRSGQEGGLDTQLSADVNLVASGIAKDCTKDMLKDYLLDKGINVVEVEKLTKDDVIEHVRTLTFRVSIKAADYEAALKPEVWPFRVSVRHYRPPRRVDRAEGGWKVQSGRSGGHIGKGSGQLQGGGQPQVAQLPSVQSLLPGHPDRVGQKQQTMGLRQPGPVDLRNFFSVLATLGGDMETNNLK